MISQSSTTFAAPYIDAPGTLLWCPLPFGSTADSRQGDGRRRGMRLGLVGGVRFRLERDLYVCEYVCMCVCVCVYVCMYVCSDDVLRREMRLVLVGGVMFRLERNLYVRMCACVYVYGGLRREKRLELVGGVIFRLERDLYVYVCIRMHVCICIYRAGSIYTHTYKYVC